jgi:hypothetical protein
MIYWGTNDQREYLDHAIIGTASRCGMEPVLVYDYEKLVAAFVAMGMEEDEAAEWISFNIEGAYVGPETPLIFYPLTGDEEES